MRNHSGINLSLLAFFKILLQWKYALGSNWFSPVEGRKKIHSKASWIISENMWVRHFNILKTVMEVQRECCYFFQHKIKKKREKRENKCINWIFQIGQTFVFLHFPVWIFGKDFHKQLQAVSEKLKTTQIFPCSVQKCIKDFFQIPIKWLGDPKEH